MTQNLALSLFPFVVSLIIEASTPLTSYYWQSKVRESAETDGTDYTEEEIDNFINFAAKPFDVIQIVSALALTFASGGVVLLFSIGANIVLTIAAVITGSVLVFLLIDENPHRYASAGRYGYSLTAAVGMILNGTFIIVISASHLCSTS